jgi:hypothetical protein
MTPRLFLSQAAVERFAAEGRAELGDGALVVTGGALAGARLEVEPALRVKAVAGGGADPHALVGKVQVLAPLRERGAECVGDSMLLEDIAYDVEPGFLASPEPALVERLVPGSHAPSVVTRVGQPDADLLARFLLSRLS